MTRAQLYPANADVQRDMFEIKLRVEVVLHQVVLHYIHLGDLQGLVAGVINKYPQLILLR